MLHDHHVNEKDKIHGDSTLRYDTEIGVSESVGVARKKGICTLQKISVDFTVK